MTASYQTIGKELEQHKTPIGTPDWDVLRRQKLKELEAHTKRPVLIYAVDFLNGEKVKAAGQDIQIQFNSYLGKVTIPSCRRLHRRLSINLKRRKS